MKLIQRTNRSFAIIILIALSIAGVLLFLTLHYFIEEEVDEKLRVDELRITEQLKKNPTFISMAPIIEVEALLEEIVVEKEIENVMLYDPIEKEEEPFRQLTTVRQINGNWYLIKVRHSIIENEDFAMAIGLTMILILLIIFTLLIVMNNRLSKTLWNPFYQNIQQLKDFSFNSEKKIQLIDSNVSEFQDLKLSLEKLTEKLQKDYRSLKEFTENASHEIQTPLSIINLHLEEVLQDEHSESNYKKLYGSYQSIQRLSKLNERLLFLAKLDNDQFKEVTDINFNELFENKLEEFIPIFADNDIQVEFESKGTFIHPCDLILANILVVNLLTNVVKHATRGCVLKLTLTTKGFNLKNQYDSTIKEEDLFERFKKGNNSSDSTGLGLSIVKRIAEVTRVAISVILTENEFEFRLNKL
ncbi:MAG: HAMP domain-containing histidine kinase [Flavobacteriales bacterium]|nr:HAMP domain-containing histidine kinase [Flavobacteriales bacterium]